MNNVQKETQEFLQCHETQKERDIYYAELAKLGYKVTELRDLGASATEQIAQLILGDRQH